MDRGKKRRRDASSVKVSAPCDQDSEEEALYDQACDRGSPKRKAEDDETTEDFTTDAKDDDTTEEFNTEEDECGHPMLVCPAGFRLVEDTSIVPFCGDCNELVFVSQLEFCPDHCKCGEYEAIHQD